MPIITAITPQKRNKERVNIFLDDQFAFGLTVKAAANLKVGAQFTPELERQINSAEEKEKARQAAFTLLSYRPRSVSEVRHNLIKKKMDDQIINQTIAELQQLGYLNDADFVRYWLEQRETFKPRGKRALQQELRQKGVDPQTIAEALGDLDELAGARKAASARAERWNHLPRRDFQTKLGGFLQRRGFSYDVIRQVTEELWEEQDDERE